MNIGFASMKIAVYAILLTGLFFTTYPVLLGGWNREDYNYCYLIPFIALYLFWEKKEIILKHESSPTWYGLVPLTIGILCYLLGELGGEYYAIYLSSWIIFAGLCWLHLGWDKIKRLAFPILILLAMFPFPHFIHNNITLKLKLISSQIGVKLIQLYGLSAYREGNIIDLGFTQLQVVDACSGLRYLFPLIILAVLLTYFIQSAAWKKITVVVSAIPLTIVINAFRIAMTGVLFEGWGAEVAQGFFHGFSGWIIFMAGLGALLLETWVLNGFRSLKWSGAQKERESQQPNGEEVDEHDTAAGGRGGNEPGKKSGFKAIISPPHFVVSIIVLGLTLVLVQSLEFREKIPIKKSFDHFPLKLGEWSGRRQSMEQRFLNILDLSDYVIVNYRNPDGREINFYTAYYESQRKGESIHSPASCLPGSGWVFNEAGRVSISLPVQDGPIMTVKKAYMLKNEYRQLSYYWFPQRGRILTNTFQLKLFAFWDAISRQRTDGALVRLITPVYKDEELEAAEQRLQEFTSGLVPVLAEFLPE